MGGGSARVGFWALVLHVLFAWFYAVSCFGSCGVRYRSIMHGAASERAVFYLGGFVARFCQS